MAKLFKVMATSLNFREAASTNAEIIAVLPRNHVVEIVSLDDRTDWCKVRTQVFLIEMEGYVANRFLVPLNQKPTVSGTGLSITTKKINQLAPNARPSVVNPLNTIADDILAQFAINQNARRIPHFFAQIAHESGGFRVLEENLNYSAKRLQEVFPNRFESEEIAEQYDHNPEMIANKIYANRIGIGNGSESSGDGWRFRGRGLIQLTGRSNYEKFGLLSGVDIVADPDIAIDAKMALKLATVFWDSRNLNTLADHNQLKTITRRINGGLNGLHDRQAYLEHARTIWG